MPISQTAEKKSSGQTTIDHRLSGESNAGKTTVFNAITGARQHVGNWPGVTVEKKEGRQRIVDMLFASLICLGYTA